MVIGGGVGGDSSGFAMDRGKEFQVGKGTRFTKNITPHCLFRALGLERGGDIYTNTKGEKSQGKKGFFKINRAEMPTLLFFRSTVSLLFFHSCRVTLGEALFAYL